VVLRVVEIAGFRGFGVPRFPENGRILFAVAFVCLTSKQYRNTATKSRKLWHTLIADAARNPTVSIIAEQLVDLLRDVPAFPIVLSHQFSTLESYSLKVECVSEWLTTTDLECDQRFKTIWHYQTLGIHKPVVYQLIDAGDIQSVSQVDDDKSVFLLLVLLGYT
jgi:hypothetical protein